MLCHRDHPEAPAWLNDEFFRDVMRESNNDSSIELTSACILRPGTSKKDHYGSVMFRTTVTYQSKRVTEEKFVDLIMKTKPEADGLMKDLLDDDGLFVVEIEMYSKVLPEVTRLLKEIGEEYKYPRYIYGTLKPHTILILEDISGQGWVEGDLINTLDDMKPIVKNVAMLHAASVILESFDTTVVTKFRHTMAHKFLGLEGLVRKGFGDLMQLTELYPEFAQFAKPLVKFQQNLRDFFDSIFKPTKSIQSVLIHGDCHTKNLLHQLDAHGRHTETILLDYQICCWTSPAIDLYYMLDLIPTQEIKDNYRSELVHLYHQQYSNLLKRLGFKRNIPSLQDLNIELIRCAGLELFHYAAFMSYRFMDQCAIDVEALLKGELENPVTKNEEYKKIMHTELTRLLHQGTLTND
uniref:CHK domain-containing protein n=1 Tax=Anopheles gambiae TaxID=7165 RepID=A0A1S4HBQ4_ANOGA